MDIGVLAEPLRTETAIVAALTTLEALRSAMEIRTVRRDGLVRHVQAHPELESVKGRSCHQLPTGWARCQMAQKDEWRRQHPRDWRRSRPKTEEYTEKLQLNSWGSSSDCHCGSVPSSTKWPYSGTVGPTLTIWMSKSS